MNGWLKAGARGLACTALVGLVGCAGTIKQDTRIQGDVSKMEGVGKVVYVKPATTAAR